MHLCFRSGGLAVFGCLFYCTVIIRAVVHPGRGGFGAVMLCINKLDGRRYAIKKIRLRSRSALTHSRILREVATLSRLQHQNVVRYYQVLPLARLSTKKSNIASLMKLTPSRVEAMFRCLHRFLWLHRLTLKAPCTRSSLRTRSQPQLTAQ